MVILFYLSDEEWLGETEWMKKDNLLNSDKKDVNDGSNIKLISFFNSSFNKYFIPAWT